MKSYDLLINWPALLARLYHDEVGAAVEPLGGRPLYGPQLVLPVRRPVAEHLVVAKVIRTIVGCAQIRISLVKLDLLGCSWRRARAHW